MRNDCGKGTHQDKIKNIKRQELGSRKTLEAELARRELSFFKEGDVVISRDDNSLLLLREILESSAGNAKRACALPAINSQFRNRLAKVRGVI